MTTLPQGDFEISSINSFANKMRCSVPLLNKLKEITEINFKKIQKIGELTGNVPCRYCGQSYGIDGKLEREIWIGMYFKNYPFPPTYQLMIGVDCKNEYIDKLDCEEIEYQLKHYPKVEESWIYVDLDNYLLHCDIKETEDEINRILKIVL